MAFLRARDNANLDWPQRPARQYDSCRGGGCALALAVGQGRASGQKQPAARPCLARRSPPSSRRSVSTGSSASATHGNRLGEAFQLALIDPGFLAVVGGLVVESGNSLYQELASVRPQRDVDPATLRRIWLDTTRQQAASGDVPALFTTVRALNASRPANRRLRVLLGEPPIEWENLKTRMTTWRGRRSRVEPGQFAASDSAGGSGEEPPRAGTVRAGHFFRKVVDRSMVTILEGAQTRVFTIWTNAAFELSSAQADVQQWPVPSLARVRGTMLGRVGFAKYLGSNAGDVPPEWLAPMEEQFDAVLYLGPLSTITLDRPTPWRCDEPAWPERIRRANLQRPGMGDRLKTQCVP